MLARRISLRASIFMGIEKRWLALLIAVTATACTATSAPTAPATSSVPAGPPQTQAAAAGAPKMSATDAPLERPAPTAPDRASSYPLKGRSPTFADGGDHASFAVSMGRSVCFGRCPQYQVTVHSDGLVEFIGERYVNAMGAHRKHIDPAQAARLLAPARQLFGAMRDYTPENKACRPYVTDHPSISLGFDDGGTRRVLRHYLGCPNPPTVLTDFEQLIDAIADVGEWTTGAAER
jgi:hypothetical protein